MTFETLRWEGLFDLEIFSDEELHGSLWQEDPADVALQGYACNGGSNQQWAIP